MNTKLSMPSTISRAVSVSRLAQTWSSLSHPAALTPHDHFAAFGGGWRQRVAEAIRAKRAGRGGEASPDLGGVEVEGYATPLVGFNRRPPALPPIKFARMSV